LEGAKDYVLSLDIDKEKLQQLRYEVSEKKLRIFITAKSGELKENNISIESAKFKYDLIIVIGTGDLENLGTIYDENSELFYEAPVVNIDHNPSNEYFGKINLVDVTVSSSSEIIFNLISSIDEKLFDENISTNLLAGIISETESFQNKNTTPKAFLAAASLVSFGANKQNITRFLYKTKSISLLKLMGKVMSNLKYNSQYKLGWSVISEEFASDDAQLENLRTAIKDLGSSSPEFNLLFVLFKQNNAIKGIINFSEKTPIDSLARLFGGDVDNGQIVFASKEQLIENAEKETLKNIKEWADGLKG
jgi:nanoRNase/pAp phosphatase (c-di-AMP/oligoRNAs hydrolase)